MKQHHRIKTRIRSTVDFFVFILIVGISLAIPVMPFPFSIKVFISWLPVIFSVYLFFYNRALFVPALFFSILSYLTIGSDVSEPAIQNPYGISGDWEVPGMSTGGNSTQIFLPGDDIDFSPYTDPEIIFFWNMENLVEIYDAGTVDKNDDIVTFNLNDPFPVSLIVQENNNSNGIDVSNDTTPPSDVFFPAISGKNTYNTIQWINPNDTDFSKVVIVRKSGSAPTSKDDGEIVYDGYGSNYCDTTGVSGTHYYYYIFAVDYAGNYSNGVLLDQVQH